MKPVLFWLAFSAFVGFFIWLIRLNRLLTEKRNQRFEVFARNRGWQFIPNAQYSSIVAGTARTEEDDIAFTIEGRSEVFGWRMWYDTSHRFDLSSDNRPSAIPFAVWACDSICARELTLMILPRWQYRIETSRIFGAIASAASAFVAAVAGVDDHDSSQRFFQRASQLKSTSPGFEDAFVVLTGPDVPRNWLDEELQVLLVRWPKGAASTRLELTATLGSKGLRIVFQRPIVDSWPFWEQFGRLGQGLALRLVRGRVAATGRSGS